MYATHAEVLPALTRRQALSTATPKSPNFAQVAADIAAEAGEDAIIDARQAALDASLNLMTVRCMSAKAALVMFGSLIEWRAAIERLYVELDRCNAAEAALAYPGASVTIDMDQIAKPANGSGVRWTGC